MKSLEHPPRLPDRARDAHKVRAGRVVVIGGRLGMAGAPALAALGAHRAGAGLVRVAVPASIQPTVAGFRPESMTVALPEDATGALGSGAEATIREALEGWDVAVLGPGLGREGGTGTLIRSLTLDMSLPLVLDADALFAWNDRLQELSARAGTLLLTPHEGEAGRLLGVPATAVAADRQAAARDLAKQSGAIVVLKGPGTIVVDAERQYVNRTGGPVLATGGTGDVLSGVIAGLIAGCGLDAFEAACVGVHAHGAAAEDLAGDCDRGLLASELAAGIPDVLLRMRAPEASA